MTPEFILQLLVALGAPVAVYGAVRADLARAIAIAEQADKSADQAHKRIDDLFNNHRTAK